MSASPFLGEQTLPPACARIFESGPEIREPAPGAVSQCLGWARRQLIPCLLVVTLAACSGKEETVVLDQRPEGITIRYDSRYSTMSGVIADEHCAKYGKSAVLANSREDESIVRPHAAIGVFDCVAN